jgi:peptide/nickel transport system substrate-binding protein
MAGISPSMAALARQDLTLRVVSYPVLFGTALFFNTTRPPFDDARVRRAVARSIDRARIVDIALAGFGRPASSPVPPESPLAWTAPAQQNIAEADSLLDLAGWFRAAGGVRIKGTRTLDVELLSVGSGDNVVEQLVQADLIARGFVLRVRQTEMGSFLTTARAADKRFDVLLAGVPGNLSLSYVSAMFATSQRGGTLDYTGFHRPELDTLLARATTAPAGEPARAAWVRVQQALDTLAPATWIYHSRGVQGLTRRLRGVAMDLRGELVTVHDWTLAR